MDPITQGALGAVFAQAFNASRHASVINAESIRDDKIGSQSKITKSQLAKQNELTGIGLIGALSAMSPDLDVLIRSSMDPLLFLEYHRQFTHSLIFIPLGALICSLVLHPLIGKRYQFSFARSYVICLLAYATHALLDACTTYGTLLYWPFSTERVAWNLVSVIDPTYTLPIISAALVAVKIQNAWIPRLVMVWVLFYPLLAYVQKERVESFAVKTLAESNPSQSEQNNLKISAKPSFGNISLWKIVYETDKQYYVDAIRLGPFQLESNAKYFKGDSINKLELERDFPWLNMSSQQAKDIERFRWFSNGYIAKDPLHENRIIDIRYSMIPNEIQALWSIELNPNVAESDHVIYANHRDSSKEKRKQFFKMLFN